MMVQTLYKTKKELKENIGEELKIAEVKKEISSYSGKLITRENGIENYRKNGVIEVCASMLLEGHHNNGWSATVTMENGRIKKVK